MRRTEAFSDAVFAIAITLLVLELPFEHVPEGRLAHELSDRWPEFAAYVVSFGSIALAWMQHRAVFDHIVRIDRRLMRLNLQLLLAIAFLPFPTALLGQYIEQGDDARTAALVFSGAWTVAAIAVTRIWSYVWKSGMLSETIDPQTARRFLAMLRTAVLGYVVFTAIALVSAIACLACYAAAAVFFMWRSDYEALGAEPVERHDSGSVGSD
jgi:uncharacterized membrane protein